MTNDQMNVALGLTAMVAVGALLIYHYNSTTVKVDDPVPSPLSDETPASNPAAPAYLSLNQPPLKRFGMSFIPNPGAPFVGSSTGGSNSFQAGYYTG